MFSRLKGRKFSVCVLAFLLLVVFVAVDTAQEKTETPNTEKGTLKTNIITEDTHPNINPYVRLVAPDKVNEPEVSENFYRPITSEVGEPPWEIEGGVSTLLNGQFGMDTYISDLGATAGSNIVDPSLATAPNGNIYCAYERRGSGNPYIRVNYSSDGGATWQVVNQIYNSTADLTQASITCTRSKVLVLYKVDDGVSPYIEAANFPYGSTTITVRSIGTSYNSDCSDPHVFTDNPCYSYGGGSGSNSAFAVWENVFSPGNVNISFYRTADSGDTWVNGTWIIGSTDSFEWKDPHGCFGNSTSHYLYITTYDNTNNNLGLIWSTLWGDGTDWQNKTLATLTYPPSSNDCNPSIAASVVPGNSRATLCFTNGSVDGDEDTGYVHTYDNGSTWFGVYTLTGATTQDEIGAVNYPDQTGRYFHLVYTHYTNRVYYSRRSQAYSGGAGWSSIRQVNDTSGSGWASYNYEIKGLACSDWDMGFPAIAWTDGGYNTLYRPYFNRLYPDDLVGTWAGQGVYYRTDRNSWVKMATPATMITTGDIDNDSTDDLLGVWPGQGGVWVKYSDSGAWSALGSTPTCIAVGDMNGDGWMDLLGSWTGQGVYYKDSATDMWIKMSSSATQIAAGDIDNDGTDDLLGVWPGQGGVWVKYSHDNSWVQLGSTPIGIVAGDMNGDGWDDLVGSWTGQGVYYRNSNSGAWVYMATEATMIETGDLDADGTDDLLGVWPSQSGSWVKFSFTNDWELLSTTPVDICGGMMRGGPNSWLGTLSSEFESLPAPEGGVGMGPGFVDNYVDLRDSGPGGKNFKFQSQKNTVPHQKLGIFQKHPGPGQFGFTFTYQKNTVPKQKIEKKK